MSKGQSPGTFCSPTPKEPGFPGTLGKASGRGKSSSLSGWTEGLQGLRGSISKDCTCCATLPPRTRPQCCSELCPLRSPCRPHCPCLLMKKIPQGWRGLLGVFHGLCQPLPWCPAGWKPTHSWSQVICRCVCLKSQGRRSGPSRPSGKGSGRAQLACLLPAQGWAFAQPLGLTHLGSGSVGGESTCFLESPQEG